MELTIRSSPIQGSTYYSMYTDDYVGKFVITKRGSTAELKYVFIVPAYRGNGVSTRGWKIVEKQLCKDGIEKIVLVTDERYERYGSLETLYRNWGFTPCGAERVVNNDDIPVRKLPMEKNLKSLQVSS